MSLRGIWKADGYGWLLQIRADGYSLFDYTDLSCVEFERGDDRQFREGFDRVELEGDRLSLYVAGDITRYSFRRVAEFHTPIVKYDDPRNTSAPFCFEVFWRTFQQDYAFFERHGVDWQAIYAKHRYRVDDRTTETELHRVFQDMLQPLHDNHVYLQTDQTHFISDKIADIKRWMVEAFELKTPSLGDSDTIARLQSFVATEILKGRARTAGNRLVTWGFVAPGVGYLCVLRLFGFADTDAARNATGLPKSRPEFARFLQQDLSALSDILDAAMADLTDARSLILDVRINGGGFDKAGMAIANRFADTRRAAFSKCARDGNGYTANQSLFVEPAGGGQFTRPVYLLTAQRTASAGEILTLCMMALPHVTRVGQPTLGIFSDDLAKHLPNGWITSLSNEIYTAPDGSLYEGDGIPPQIVTPVFSEADFKNRLKIAVDTAAAQALRS